MGSVKDLKVVTEPRGIMGGKGEFVFSDRYSVFDWGEMPDPIRNKGRSLCTTSAYFFEQVRKRGRATHYAGVGRNGLYVDSLDQMAEAPDRMRVVLARVIKPVASERDGQVVYDYTPVTQALGNFVIPIEVIYRNSLPKGSSVFRRLKEGTLTLAEMGLTEMPSEGQRLAEPFLDGSTKYEEFDRYPGWAELRSLAGITTEEFEDLRDYVLIANHEVSEAMERAGFFNEDGKFEFVFSPFRTLVLADTLGTLDECRITYKGVDISKQIPRDWYAHSQPEWKAQIDAAKKANKKDWKSHVSMQPEPLPYRLKEIMEMIYMSVANRVTGTNFFAEPPSIDELVGEYEKFKAAEMK